MKRLSESMHKVDFFKLANNFESQINKAFCGPATATIVLNALRVRTDIDLPADMSLLKEGDQKYLPKREGWLPVYQRYTQNTIFNKSPKPRTVVLGEPVNSRKDERSGKEVEGVKERDFGFQIRQIAELLEAHQLEVELAIVSDGALDDSGQTNAIKAQMIENLKNKGDYLIVNYKRSKLNQQGGGHISPVGAYHQASDSFLIMDTVPNKADWVWVSADKLFEAMGTFDTVENRGFVSVQEGVKPVKETEEESG